MYIRKTVRRYKDKTYVNFLLVESVLTDKGPRQKVICSLCDLSPRPPEQRVLYEVLGVPTETIRPVKTWERNQPNSD